MLRGLSIYTLVVIFLTFTLFPIYWTVNSSLKASNELFRFPAYWPASLNVANYVDALTKSGSVRLSSTA